MRAMGSCSERQQTTCLCTRTWRCMFSAVHPLPPKSHRGTEGQKNLWDPILHVARKDN